VATTDGVNVGLKKPEMRIRIESRHKPGDTCRSDAPSRIGAYLHGTARHRPASLTTRLPLQSLPDTEELHHERRRLQHFDPQIPERSRRHSQRKIEETVRERQIGGKKLKVRMTLTAEGTGLTHVVDGEIELP
jgi:hypothetical protein